MIRCKIIRKLIGKNIPFTCISAEGSPQKIHLGVHKSGWGELIQRFLSRLLGAQFIQKTRCQAFRLCSASSTRYPLLRTGLRLASLGGGASTVALLGNIPFAPRGNICAFGTSRTPF